jgi:hypothetical protein
VTRQDGTAFHFTDHDQNLDIDLADGLGVQTYKADSSFNRSAIKSDDKLAVDNLDLTGVLDSVEITESELRRGLFDFATVHIFHVNWQNLADGIIRMRKGHLGEVVLTDQGFYMTELRGLTQQLTRTITELYSAECRADLGDSRCGVPIAPALVNRNQTYAVGDTVRAVSEQEAHTDPVLLVHANTDAVDSSRFAASPSLGTETAVQQVQAQLGTGSIEFSPTATVDPSESFVSYPSSPSFDFTGQELTIECFVRFKDLTDTTQVFVSKYLNTGNQRGFIFERSSGDLRFRWSTDGVTLDQSITGAFAWAINTWYHVAVTRDASNDWRLYVAGNQVGSTTTNANDIFFSSEVLRLGKRRSAGFDDDPLNGFIDEVRIVCGDAIYTGATLTVPVAEFQTLAEAFDITTLTTPSYDDRLYVCTTAGRTQPAQPVYDTIVTNTTNDGDAVFTTEEAWTRGITVLAVDVGEPRKKFTVTQLTPNSGAGIDGKDQFPADAMNGGAVIWETGLNAGRVMEVRDFVADDGVTIEQDIELFLDMPFDIAVSDTAAIYRGCLKRAIADCKNIFDNIENFRGEPYVPGIDTVSSFPDAKAS